MLTTKCIYYMASSLPVVDLPDCPSSYFSWDICRLFTITIFKIKYIDPSIFCIRIYWWGAIPFDCKPYFEVPNHTIFVTSVNKAHGMTWGVKLAIDCKQGHLFWTARCVHFCLFWYLFILSGSITTINLIFATIL